MKTTSLILTVLLGLLFTNANAQSEKKKVETIEIKTSAVCGMCKNTIETALYQLKGVKSASLDVPSKVVTVKYKTASVTSDEIKKAITLAGYDADDMPADAQAYEKLHACCKKGTHH